MHGQPEEVEGSSFLEFAGVAPSRYRIYPPDSQVAEKLHAYTLPRERPNSRVKDLPDLVVCRTNSEAVSPRSVRHLARRQTQSHP